MRHGECDVHGKLTDLGEEQALAAADFLLGRELGRDALILVATMQRATKFGAIIARRLNIPTILHSKRVTAAGISEVNGVRHFGQFIDQTLQEYNVPYRGLIVVGSEPLIGRARDGNPDAAIGFGEIVSYEYDPNNIIPDKTYFSSISQQRLENIRPPWEPVQIGE